MCKAMQLYGLSANEALKLSDSQVTTMLEHAETVASSLLAGNPTFQQALGQRLAPVKRAVRAAAEEGFSSGGTDSGSGTGGGPVGPPPSF